MPEQQKQEHCPLQENLTDLKGIVRDHLENGAGADSIGVIDDQSGHWIVERVSDGYALHRAVNDIKKVYLEVTTRCNLSCENCVRNAWDEPLRDMSPETFDRIMENLRALPELREVYFGGYGEPLLHPNIEEMVEQIKSLGVRVTLTTNGTMLTKEKVEALMNSHLDRLFVSIDSPRADLFSEIRGGADLDLVVENLKRVKTMRDERGSRLPTVGLEFVMTRKNLDDIHKLPDLAREVGASIVLLTHLLPHSEEMVDLIAYGTEEVEMPKSVGWAVVANFYVMWGILSTPRGRWGAYKRCHFVNDKGVVIGWDGGVSPCYALMHSYPCYIFGDKKQISRYVIGNLNDRSLTDIWTSREYTLFRSTVGDFKLPSCVDCGLNCDLRQQNADCWANEPSCADCLWVQDIIRCP